MKKKIILILSSVMIIFLFIPQPRLFSHSEADEQSKTGSKTDSIFDMSLEQLMNVKITTAGKAPEKISDIPASVVLITREDIETYGYTTLTEILANIPGLYSVNDYGEEGTNFGVRGFWSGVPNRNMIILVNDVSQINDYQFNYPLSKINIPVEAIDRIEVIRGPMSVVYGSGAFYGVINIITDKKTRKPSSILSSSLGSAKTKRVVARIADKEGDLHYVFDAYLFDTYGIDQPLNEMVSNPSILPALGVPEDHRTNGRLENNAKYFNFSGSLKNFYLNMSYNVSRKEFYFGFPSYSTGTYLKNNHMKVSFGYRKDLSKIIKINGKFGYFYNRDWYRYNFLSDDWYGIQKLESDAWEAELNVFINPSSLLEIATGLSYRSVLDTSNMYDLPSVQDPSFENSIVYLPPGENIVTRALFAQINYNPFKSLRLVGGLRMEQSPRYRLSAEYGHGTDGFSRKDGIYDQDKIEIIPRFAAIYYLNKRNIFKFLYGKAINRPSFDQNRQNSLDPIERPHLKPESIQTLELNYIGTISPEFTLNISVFRNSLKNLITRVVVFEEDDIYYQTWSDNGGRMVTTGVELTLNAEPFNDFRMELNGTFQGTDNKRTRFENINVAYSPKLLGYLKAAYRGYGFRVAVIGNYVGRMETHWDHTIKNPDDSFGARIGEKVGGYFVLGANLRLDDLFIDGLYLNIKCLNLLDEKIRYPTTTINDWLDKGTIGMGRSFLVSVGYKF